MIQYTFAETGGRCGRPPVIENGDTLEVAALQYASDAVVTYKCQLYYLMHGQSAVRCVNGHWTEAPTCKGIESICSSCLSCSMKQYCESM